MLKLLFICSLIVAASSPRAQAFPQTAWQNFEAPANAGWNMGRLDSLRAYIRDSTPVTGYMIIQHGKVVFEYGDIQENSYIASCRKSVLAILYGEHIKTGEINLQANLKKLGINDVGGLLPAEQEATITDVLSARSGVFHPASYPGDFLSLAPARGSVKHGAYWLYSNWDFNVAGYIFEKETGKNIYDEIQRQLAVPLGMQDWDRALQQKEGDSSQSFYPAYPMWFSTRDMARIGLLMLNKGRWGNRQLIDSGWVKDMVTPKTLPAEVNAHVPIFRGTDFHFGYGYFWWLWLNVTDSRLAGGYTAMGSLGQSITVFPAIDMVIVYKTKAAYDRNTSFQASLQLLTYPVQSYQTNILNKVQ